MAKNSCFIRTFILIFMVLNSAGFAYGTSEVKSERNLLQFARMIRCLTVKSSFREAKDYNGYGCYCGYGGNGMITMIKMITLDETDRCCFTHDNCYNDAINSGKCTTYEVYFVPYEYTKSKCKTSRASVTCVENDYSFFWSKECADAVCECDANAARCFAEVADTFNKDYCNWPQDKCT